MFCIAIRMTARFSMRRVPMGMALDKMQATCDMVQVERKLRTWCRDSLWLLACIAFCISAFIAFAIVFGIASALLLGGEIA